MIEAPAASSRYELEVGRLSLLRRARGFVLTAAEAFLSLGSGASSPAIARFRIIDRTTGEAVAVLNEQHGESIDVEQLVRNDLATMAVDEFERAWLPEARSD